VTAQALTALAGKQLPIAPPRSHAAAAAAVARTAAAVATVRRSHSRRAHTSARAAAPPLPVATGMRLNSLARSIGALLGAVVGPMLR
jgi:hypothetical protein